MKRDAKGVMRHPCVPCDRPPPLRAGRADHSDLERMQDCPRDFSFPLTTWTSAAMSARGPSRSTRLRRRGRHQPCSSRASSAFSLAIYPVPGRTLDDVRAGHQQNSAARLRDARPDLPTRLVEAIERGLAGDPSQRHQTARAFEAALTEPQDHRAGGREWRAWAAVAVGVMAIGAVAWSLRGTTPDGNTNAGLAAVSPAPERCSLPGPTAVRRRPA